MSVLKSSIPLLGEELKRRFLTPIGQVSFWTYFIVAIFGFGALGVWVEVSRAMAAKKFELDGLDRLRKSKNILELIEYGWFSNLK